MIKFIFSGALDNVNYQFSVTSYNQEKMGKTNHSSSLKFKKLIR